MKTKFRIFEIGQVEVTKYQIAKAKRHFSSLIEENAINPRFANEVIELQFEYNGGLWCSYVIEGIGVLGDVLIKK